MLFRVLRDEKNMVEDAIDRCREPNLNYNSPDFGIEDLELF